MDTEKSNTELESRMLSTAIEAAKEGGEVLMTHLSRVQHYEVEHKDTFDYVTAVDRARGDFYCPQRWRRFSQRQPDQRVADG